MHNNFHHGGIEVKSLQRVCHFRSSVIIPFFGGIYLSELIIRIFYFEVARACFKSINIIVVQHLVSVPNK